jgi:hypothetical protein
MITDTYILKEFEEHELFMDMETRPLRLIQLDLHRFGLGKFHICTRSSLAKWYASIARLTFHLRTRSDIYFRQVWYYPFGGKTINGGWH